MKAAIITIGDEILIGQTVDTNSAWMGAELDKAGFDVFRMTSIHDRRDDIIKSLSQISGKADVVLITGGLGPTSDDITKSTLCEYFDTKLVMNREVLKMIETRITQRNLVMNDNNRKQAEVPESCKVLTNAAGTAPGMWFEKDSTIFVSMPGVPYEMKYIMTEHVLPELIKRFTSQVIINRNIMTYGTFEAKLAELLSGFESALPPYIKLAYLPASGIIKLRLTATGSARKQLEKSINEQVKKLYDVIPQYIYGENEESLEMVIGHLLQSERSTVGTAESCTGGMIAHMITSVPGSSAYFNGSIIAYSNLVKTKVLGVNEELIKEYGAVSEQVAMAMADGARRVLETDYAISITGVAGPNGGSAEKPVGSVWIAVAAGDTIVAEKYMFGNERLLNIRRFSIAALNLLRKQITNK